MNENTKCWYLPITLLHYWYLLNNLLQIRLNRNLLNCNNLACFFMDSFEYAAIGSVTRNPNLKLRKDNKRSLIIVLECLMSNLDSWKVSCSPQLKSVDSFLNKSMKINVLTHLIGFFLFNVRTYVENRLYHRSYMQNYWKLKRVHPPLSTTVYEKHYWNKLF